MTMVQGGNVLPPTPNNEPRDTIFRAARIAGAVALNRTLGWISARRMELAGRVMARMDDHISGYEGLAIIATALPSETHPILYPQTLFDRLKASRMEKRRARYIRLHHVIDMDERIFANVMPNVSTFYDPKYVPNPNAGIPNPTSNMDRYGNMRRSIERRRDERSRRGVINRAYREGGMSAEERRIAKLAIPANIKPIESPYHRRNRKALNRAELLAPAGIIGLVLNDIHVDRQERAIGRIQVNHRRAERYHSRVEQLEAQRRARP